MMGRVHSRFLVVYVLDFQPIQPFQKRHPGLDEVVTPVSISPPPWSRLNLHHGHGELVTMVTMSLSPWSRFSLPQEGEYTLYIL